LLLFATKGYEYLDGSTYIRTLRKLYRDGVAKSVQRSEDHPQTPINPYGASKLMVERILADFDAAYDFKSVCLRYFNAAGAEPTGLLGEGHQPEGLVYRQKEHPSALCLPSAFLVE
jgi:nucleoside-diphosphate-sugar epimerase